MSADPKPLDADEFRSAARRAARGNAYDGEQWARLFATLASALDRLAALEAANVDLAVRLDAALERVAAPVGEDGATEVERLEQRVGVLEAHVRATSYTYKPYKPPEIKLTPVLCRACGAEVPMTEVCPDCGLRWTP